jgi:predicted dehydrogenase
VLRRRRRGPTVALAGAGAIATVHALAAEAAGLRVVAVASAGGTSARHLAGQLDARRVRPDELPAGADLLVVATPPDSHVGLTLVGMTAGASVLVEKPLAPTLAAADRLVAAEAALAEQGAPVVVRCGENLLHAPAWREVAARRDALGPLTHLSARTVQPPPTWGHFTRPLTAGGVLFDLGPHALALVLELAGSEPVAVTAHLSSGRDDGADDEAEVLVRFADGLEATVELAWTAAEPHWALQASGSSGVLRLELFPEVVVEADGDEVRLPPLRHDAADASLEGFGYVDQLVDLAAGGVGGQTLDGARRVLEVVCAAYASAGAGGTPVALPFTGDRTRTPLELWRS